MKDEYVEYETAVLARDKGFNIPCLFVFDDDDGYITASYCETVFKPINYNTSSYKRSKPTQSVLQKWLREVHKIHIEIPVGPYTNTYHAFISDYGYIYIAKDKNDMWCFQSYEEALEEALIIGLKQIK